MLGAALALALNKIAEHRQIAISDASDGIRIDLPGLRMIDQSGWPVSVGMGRIALNNALRLLTDRGFAVRQTDTDADGRIEIDGVYLVRDGQGIRSFVSKRPEPV